MQMALLLYNKQPEPMLAHTCKAFFDARIGFDAQLHNLLDYAVFQQCLTAGIVKTPDGYRIEFDRSYGKFDIETLNGWWHTYIDCRKKWVWHKRKSDEAYLQQFVQQFDQHTTERQAKALDFARENGFAYYASQLYNLMQQQSNSIKKDEIQCQIEKQNDTLLADLINLKL